MKLFTGIALLVAAFVVSAGATEPAPFYQLDPSGNLYSFPSAADFATNTNDTLCGNLGVGGGDVNAIASDGTLFYRLDVNGNLYSFSSVADLGTNTNETIYGNPDVGGGGENSLASVPEPATLGLLILGGLALLKHKRVSGE